MTKTSKIEAITRFNANDRALQPVKLAEGEAVCFSSRSPTKDSANEDALAIIPVDGQATILAVADGLGGMPAGEQASQILMESLIEALENDRHNIRDAILRGIDNANRQILRTESGAGTTLSIAEISGNKMRAYQAGDSLVLLAGAKGQVKYQALSQSPIGYALICGALDEEQAMLHPARNLISNYVGCNDMHITIGPFIELAPSDTLILCSDAVSDNLYEEEICQLIHAGPLRASVSKLLKQCQHNMLSPRPDRLCHPDDLTLISFRARSAGIVAKDGPEEDG